MVETKATSASPFSHCAECGAERHPEGRFCWLCGAVLADIVLPQKEEVIVAEVVPASLSAGQQRLLIWLAVVLVAIVGFGALASQDWIIASLFAVVVVPTMLVVLLGTTSARVRGTPWTPGKTVAVAATTAASTVLTTVIVVIVVLAVAVLVLFAMIIALFEQCLQMLGGGGS
jgi:hypothetical protein